MDNHLTGGLMRALQTSEAAPVLSCGSGLKFKCRKADAPHVG